MKKKTGKAQPVLKKKKTDAMLTIDPGPIATPEQAYQANADAHRLLEIIWPLNLSGAAKHVRENPPAPETIAMLGFLAYKVLSSARARNNAKGKRKKVSLAQQMRDLKITKYSQLENEAPEIRVKYTREQLGQAISKAKKPRNK